MPREPGRLGRLIRKGLISIGAFTVISMIFFLIASIVALRGDRIPDEVLLELDLSGTMVESVPNDALEALLRREELTLRDATDAIRRGAADDRVNGLVARLGTASIGLAQVEELRDAVAEFRSAGKPTVFFSETFGEFGPGHASYYLATAFEEIHLQPSGDLGLAGLIAETPFVAGTLETIGVEPRIGQRYEYKNAADMFMRSEMTDAHREATQRVLESVYANLVAGIAQGRNLEVAGARALADGGPYLAREALDSGLVDRLSYRDEAFESLRERAGGDFVLVEDYLSAAGRPHRRGQVVALIYGTGTIQRGVGGVDPLGGGAAMGSESVGRAFRDAIEDDEVAAILFRVDSPGGSYVASDVIWRETLRARRAGKPVIVSMGNTAASGGYFVAMGANHIVAQPSTLTGSIGVYGGKVLIGEASEKLGVTWDDVRVGGNPTMWSSVVDYSPAEWQRLQLGLDRIYADFTAKVAEGRGISPDSVHAIARGRVWTGSDALRLGLVDELGGIETALAAARRETGLEPEAPIDLRVFPRERSLLELLLDRREDSAYPPEALTALLTSLQPILTEARRLGLFGGSGALTMPPLEIRY